MKSTQLSDHQIEKLFAFVKSKYVYYIDMQHELVDHLACEIEILMAGNEHLTFEKALTQVYSKYPITGFSNLKDAKVTAMNRYWMRIYFNYIFTYFKLPKILITLALAYLFYTILGVVTNVWIIVIFVLISIVHFYLIIKIRREYSYEQQQKYLFLNAFFGLFGTTSITPLIITFEILNHPAAGINLPVQIFLSILAAYHIIMLNAMANVFPEKLKSDIQQKYPYMNLKAT